jgi:hypothetical protein
MPRGNLGGVPWKAAMSEVKRFTRIAADAAGGSTFQDDEFPLDSPQGAPGMRTGTGHVTRPVGDPPIEALYLPG